MTLNLTAIGEEERGIQGNSPDDKQTGESCGGRPPVWRRASSLPYGTEVQRKALEDLVKVWEDAIVEAETESKKESK